MKFNLREYIEKWLSDVQGEIVGINREIDRLELEEIKTRNRLDVYGHRHLSELYSEEINCDQKNLDSIYNQVEELKAKRTKASKLEFALKIKLEDLE